MSVMERSDKLDKIRDDWKARSIWKLEVAERARILRCQTTQEEQDMLLVEGFFSYVCKNRPLIVTGSGNLLDITKQRVEKKRREKEKQKVIVRKAKAFDRLIERLDHQYVGGKLLGDCTRADLLRAAQNASQGESSLNLDRTLYTELAALLKGDETVREARQRGEVRKLLENRYGADAQ